MNIKGDSRFKRNGPRPSTRLSISVAASYICSKSQKRSPEEKASGTKPQPCRCCGICLRALTNHCASCGKSAEGPEGLAVYLGPDGRSRVVGREWSVIAIPGLSSGAGREEPLWTNHHDRAKERLREKHSLPQATLSCTMRMTSIGNSKSQVLPLNAVLSSLLLIFTTRRKTNTPQSLYQNNVGTAVLWN